MKNKKTLVIDGSSLLFRAFFATAKKTENGWFSPMRNQNGEATNAIRVFINMIFNLVNRYNPDYLLIALDSEKKSFRHDFDFYKSTRSTTPDDLITQFTMLKEFLLAANIKGLEIDGLEADDVIGSFARNFDTETLIVSGDKDMFQLITKKDIIVFPDSKTKEYIEYTENKFIEKYDLNPIQMIDLKALMGDSSDNIPGVKGIGEKTGIKILKEYKSIENLYSQLENDNFSLSDSVKNKLLVDKENAFLSKKIATILTTEDLGIKISDLTFDLSLSNELKDFLMDNNLYSILNKYE